MNIIALVALPIFVQAAAASVCPINQYLAPGVDVCYEITPSVFNAKGMDSRLLDLTSFQYLQTKWLDPGTMLSRVETATTTYCWYDDQTTGTFPCQ